MDAVAYSTSSGANNITEQWRLCVQPFYNTSNASLPSYDTKKSDADSLMYSAMPTTFLLVTLMAMMVLLA